MPIILSIKLFDLPLHSASWETEKKLFAEVAKEPVAWLRQMRWALTSHLFFEHMRPCIPTPQNGFLHKTHVAFKGIYASLNWWSLNEIACCFLGFLLKKCGILSKSTLPMLFKPKRFKNETKQLIRAELVLKNNVEVKQVFVYTEIFLLLSLFSAMVIPIFDLFNFFRKID